ncbi:hypothetical protein [Campylobacter sp. RM16190]|uniref:hypothetical protein n=1 Tax=Campylobacter sp. RM16190 TaxID=1705727 RepID=UPI001474ECA5|nr:hypothetical protein [Campylobacter sp. RM16190]
MTKLDYAKHLANLMQINLYSGDLKDLSACFYGLFEEFMPYGDGVDKVFEPLVCAKDLQDRIMPLYEANKDKANAFIKAGFTPIFSPLPSNDKAKLIALGKSHIDSLKKFAEFINDKELLERLKRVHEVAIWDIREAIWKLNLDEQLYKAITKWRHKAEFIDEKAAILKEAYGSVVADALLINYLLYPALRHKPKEDFLKSCFEIYLLGHLCEFDKHKLEIYPLAV